MRFFHHPTHISLREIIEARDILIVDAAKDLAGDDNVRPMMLFIMRMLHRQMQRQVRLPEDERPRVPLIVDEAHYIAGTENFVDQVATHRRGGLEVACGLQYFAQLGSGSEAPGEDPQGPAQPAAEPAAVPHGRRRRRRGSHPHRDGRLLDDDPRRPRLARPPAGHPRTGPQLPQPLLPGLLDRRRHPHPQLHRPDLPLPPLRRRTGRAGTSPSRPSASTPTPNTSTSTPSTPAPPPPTTATATASTWRSPTRTRTPPSGWGRAGTRRPRRGSSPPASTPPRSPAGERTPPARSPPPPRTTTRPRPHQPRATAAAASRGSRASTTRPPTSRPPTPTSTTHRRPRRPTGPAGERCASTTSPRPRRPSSTPAPSDASSASPRPTDRAASRDAEAPESLRELAFLDRINEIGPADQLDGATSLPRLYDQDYAILALLDRAGLAPASLIGRATMPGRAGAHGHSTASPSCYRHGLDRPAHATGLREHSRDDGKPPLLYSLTAPRPAGRPGALAGAGDLPQARVAARSSSTTPGASRTTCTRSAGASSCTASSATSPPTTGAPRATPPAATPSPRSAPGATATRSPSTSSPSRPARRSSTSSSSSSPRSSPTSRSSCASPTSG